MFRGLSGIYSTASIDEKIKRGFKIMKEMWKNLIKNSKVQIIFLRIRKMAQTTVDHQ